MPGGSRTAVEALSAGRPQRIGRYTYRVDDDSWWWSDTFYRILGFEPGEVVASPAVLAAHLRPHAMDRGVESVETAFVTGEPFSFHTEIIDSGGNRRTVLLAGHGEPGESGSVDVVSGYLVDLTEARREASLVDVSEALSGALEHRAVIEQAKGVLVLAQGVTADEAFELLRAYSQDNNIKVRDVAARLVERAAEQDPVDGDFLRTVLQVFDLVD